MSSYFTIYILNVCFMESGLEHMSMWILRYTKLNIINCYYYIVVRLSYMRSSAVYQTTEIIRDTPTYRVGATILLSSPALNMWSALFNMLRYIASIP